MVVGFAPSTAPRDLSDRDIERSVGHASRGSASKDLTSRDIQPAFLEWFIDRDLIEAAEHLVRTRLDSLMGLRQDWDSYGGQPLQLPAADYAERLLVPLLAQRVAPPAIVPTSEGGLSLEWDHGAKHLVIQVPSRPQEDGDEPTAYFSDDDEGIEWEDALSGSLYRVREALASFAT